MICLSGAADAAASAAEKANKHEQNYIYRYIYIHTYIYILCERERYICIERVIDIITKNNNETALCK